MRITPLGYFSKVQPYKLNQNIKQTSPKEARNISYISQPYFGNFFIHRKPLVEFKYSKISSTRPNYEIFECDYNNLDEFCEKYAKKLNSQLAPISKTDLQILINKIKNQTGAQEDLIKEVLFQLTSFTRHNSIKALEEEFRKSKIGYFGIENMEISPTVCDFSTNQGFNYLAKKVFYLLHSGEKRGIVLDDFVLTQLEELKNSTDERKRKQFEEIIKDVNNNNVTFFNIKGWDIKCSDGNYRNTNMFYGTGFLESLAIDTIKRHQKGEKLDNILYSDLEKRLKHIFKGEKITKELDIVKISNNKTYKKSNYDILNNINKPLYAPDEIKEKILTFSKPKQDSTNPIELQKTIMKYLNEFSIIYSTDTLAQNLISLKNKITNELQKEGYNEDEIQYVITAPKKSFGLITNMYCKINGISLDNIAYAYDKKTMLNQKNKNKARVILDDMSISGLSQSCACNKVNDLLKAHNINSPICYATVLNTDKAEEYLDLYPEYKLISLKKAKLFGRAIDPQLNYSNKNFSNELDKYCQDNFQLLKKEDCIRILNNLELGFLNSGLACEFPHMLPDNNSQLATSIFSEHLYS